MPQITRIIVNGIHWAANVDIPDASKEVKTFHLAPKRTEKDSAAARARRQ